MSTRNETQHLDNGAQSGELRGHHPEANPLSDREMEVARLLATGASNAEIARDLVISPHTVKVHLRNIFDKLQVSSRTEATMLLVQRGWISVPGMVRGDEGGAVPEAAPTLAPLGDLPARVAPWQRLFLLGAILLALGFLVWPWWQSQARSSPPLLSDAGVSAVVPQVNLDERWEALAPLQIPRSRHAATLVEDRLLVFGGETDGGSLLRDVSAYDLTMNRWRELAPLPVAVSNLSAATLGDSVYVAGGTIEREGPAAEDANNGRRVPSSSLLRYEREANRWHVAGELPMPLAGAVLVSDGGALYLIGGWDGTAVRDEVWRLVVDPATARPLAEAGVAPVSPLEADAGATPATPSPAAEAVVTPFAGTPSVGTPSAGRALATLTPRGGLVGSGVAAANAQSPLGTPVATATRRLRLPVTVAPSATPRAQPTVQTTPTAVPAAEGVTAGEWELVTRLAAPRAFLGSVLVEDQLYVAGGFDGRREVARADVYDLTTGRWQSLPDMRVARSGFVLVFDGVALLALGGGWLDTVVEHERLDPAINIWTLFESPLEGSWRHLAAASLQGNLYLVGGWSGDYLNT
ncbi:MAG: Kelch repeat-containing protein, partial [Caldilineaceae bacterium]